MVKIMGRYVHSMIGIILAVITILLTIYLITPLYDREEVEVAIGETYDLTSDWTLTDGIGNKQDINFPYEISVGRAKSVSLSHALSEEYESLALSFYAENAALRIFVGGKPIYEAGFSDTGASPNNGRWGWEKREIPDDPDHFEKQPEGKPDEAIDKQPERKPDEVIDKQPELKPGEVLDISTNNIPNIPNDKTNDQINETPNEEILTLEDMSSEDSSAEDAGEIIADLPNSISDDDEIVIKLTQVRPDKSIYIYGASVAKRDVTVIGMLRDSVFPMVLCILILLMSVVLLTLDVVRFVSGKRMRGLSIMALLGLDAILFIMMQTDMPSLFFGNKDMFDKLCLVCVVLMPPLLAFFYQKGFQIHFPRTTRMLSFITSIGTILVLFLDYTGTKTLTEMGVFTFTLLVLVTVGIFVVLVRFKKISEYNTIWWDVAGLMCFILAILLAFSTNFIRQTELIIYTKDVLVTAFFFFITGQHIHIMLNEYKKGVEKNARILEAQVRIAEEARLEADIANEAKGKFLANMSHEIRTPINAVLGMDEMILRESREKEIRNYAMDIYTAGQTLLSLINDILDLSKIESGKMEIVSADYDFCSIIHDLSNMISLKAKNKGLSFEVKVDSKLPSRMYGDDVRIKQVLTNILTNAVKYTEKGTVWLRVSGKRDGEDELLHFEVEDTGIGIKEEDMSKLFEAYQRIEEGRNRHIEGTGLGMNITMQLLNMMGSKLQVKSEYGKGSLFFFDLRQRVTNDTPVGDFEKRMENIGDQYSYDCIFIAPDARILLVDDNSVNRKVFCSLLKQTQIQVTEAGSGQEAIDLASSVYFDLIFMDHMMPEMDGIEALHRIRALQDYPCEHTPIFVLTANAVTGAKEEYLAAGFDGFLSKPIVSAKLEEVIREYLPTEKILPVPEEEREEKGRGIYQSYQGAPLDDLPVIDGLDWEFAWLHLPDKELLESALKEFYTILALHADKLDDMKDKLPDTLDEYRIHVHGMKSAAASVGILPLAGMAKVLEFAARDKNIDKILSLHSIFISEWRSYREKLHGVFGIGEESDTRREEASSDIVSALLSMIQSALENMDIDGADQAMEKLSSYQLIKEAMDELEKLKAAVADLDEAAAEKIAKNITKIYEQQEVI